MSIFNSIRFLVLTGLSLFFTAVILADTHYVRPPPCTNTDLQSPYTSWDDAATNIQWAVNVAETNDTVLVSNGVYTTVAPTYWALDPETNSSVVCISNPMTLRSVNGPSNTVIDGNSANGNSAITSRCVFISKGATLEGFTVRNGYASNAFCNYACGGGVRIYPRTNYGPPYGGMVTNCIVYSNYAQLYGGGISAAAYAEVVNNITMVVANCVIYTNQAYHGGGMYVGGGTVGSTGETFVLNCSIISNIALPPDAGNGGGIYATATGAQVAYLHTTLFNCNFSFNKSGGYGRAIYIIRADIINCGISNHSSSAGYYAVMLYNGTMKNCSILNNYNNTDPALLLLSSSATNCVVANNGKGGGAVVYGGSANQCIFSNNLNNSAEIDMGGVTVYPAAGGVFVHNNSLLRNCLICNNTNTKATGIAGGVYVTNAAVDRSIAGLINCTIVNNWSTNNGGGICARGINNYIVNCIIANNTAPSNSDVYTIEEVNTNNFYYCSVNTNLAPNQGNITNDPVFVNANADNWRLNVNSPCLNKGTNQNWMTNGVDLDGKTRIRYGRVDMGVYETIYDGTIFTVP